MIADPTPLHFNPFCFVIGVLLRYKDLVADKGKFVVGRIKLILNGQNRITTENWGRVMEDAGTDDRGQAFFLGLMVLHLF